MKARLQLFVILGVLICVAAVVATATKIGTIPAPQPSHAVITAPDAAAPGSKVTSGNLSQSNPEVATNIADRIELCTLLDDLRAAKREGRTLPEDKLLRLNQLRPPVRNSDHLDQGGEDCATAVAITTLPYNDTGSTFGYADDTPECDGSGTGPDVAYSYTPGATANFHVSLCGSSYDTKIAVYEDNCTGTPVECNDDGNCWPGSDIPNFVMNGGTTYYFVIDGWNGDFGDYAFFLEELAPTPPGDNCADPIIVPSLPYVALDETNCPYMSDYAGTTCLISWNDGPDAIYQFTLATTTSLEIILTPSLADPPNETYVMPAILLSDHCPPDFSCIDYEDEWTVAPYLPLVLECNSLAPGTYYVLITNGTWYHACMTYDLEILPCGPCDITAQPGDVEEVAETFPLPGTFSINDPNGGCNNDDPYAPQFQTITGGQTVHGRTFAYTDSITNATIGDNDWYRIVLISPNTITCTYTGETSLQAFLYEPPCASLPIAYGVQTTPCATRSFTSGCLGQGEYYIKIGRGNTFTGPEAPLDYRATFTLTPCALPSGRCCYAGTCTMNTEPDCDLLFGYWDQSLTCADPCPDYPPNDHCQNAGVPAPLPATFTGDNTNATNDCWQEGDPQVWHVFTTTELSDIQVDYCGTENFHSFNPWLYASCPCDERDYIEAVDWGFCVPFTAMTGLWRDVPAGTWYISVTMYNPNSIGPYTIHVNAVSNLPPENDDCANATPLTVPANGSVTVAGTTMNAATSCIDACFENGFTYNSSGGDVFYSISLNQCRKLAFALGTSDMHLSIYNGLELCCTDPAFLCNDDDANFTPLPTWDVPAQHPGGSQSYIAAEFEPGLYLIRVAKYGGQVGAYTLTVYDNGACYCTPPDAPIDLNIAVNGDDVELRWSTDAASAARGFYRIWSNTEFVAFDDPSWLIVADGVTPVVENNHLYYTGPWNPNDKLFYVVTGVCPSFPETPAR